MVPFGRSGEWPIFRGDPGLRGLAAGELAADPRECRPACWYYLTRPRLLVYRPGRADHLTGARELRFRVVAEPGSGGLRLVPVRAYRWF